MNNRWKEMEALDKDVREKYLKKLVRDYVDNHNDYMMESASNLTNKNLKDMEFDIVFALLVSLGYELKEGIWVSK